MNKSYPFNRNLTNQFLYYLQSLTIKKKHELIFSRPDHVSHATLYKYIVKKSLSKELRKKVIAQIATDKTNKYGKDGNIGDSQARMLMSEG